MGAKPCLSALPLSDILISLDCNYPSAQSAISMHMAESRSTSELLQQPVLFLDGGLGTTLENEHGVVFSSEATPLWSSHLLISAPATLKRVHADFVEAGADVLLTATYQASIDGFEKTPCYLNSSSAGADEYMRNAVTRAREAFNSKPGIVALSLGAYGATMIPSTEYSGLYGNMTEMDILSFHRDRLAIFLKDPETWANIDVLAFETLPRLNEIRAVRRATSLLPPHRRKPYWISCVFPSNDDMLPDGTSIREAITALLSTDSGDPPFAIGINCTNTNKLQRLVLRFETAILDGGFTFPRLVLYPDGACGQVYDTKLQTWFEVDCAEYPKSWHEQLVEVMHEIQQRHLWKALLVGGCCKTTPSHIKHLRCMWERGSL